MAWACAYSCHQCLLLSIGCFGERGELFAFVLALVINSYGIVFGISLLKLRFSVNLWCTCGWIQSFDQSFKSRRPHVADHSKTGRDSRKNGEIEQSFDQATVMFSSLIGFTELCARYSPATLAVCVNSVFDVFDSIVDYHNVFKARLKSQTLLIWFVVDLLYNKLYNKSTTNPQQIE